jgi:uncharacterized protein YkwD
MEPLSSATPRATTRRTLGTVLAVFLAALTLAAAAALRAEGDPSSASAGLVNAARSGAGLAPLARHPGLDEVAGVHALRMVARDAIFHNGNLKAEADAAGVDWLWIGENARGARNVYVMGGDAGQSAVADFVSSLP